MNRRQPLHRSQYHLSNKSQNNYSREVEKSHDEISIKQKEINLNEK